MRVAVADDGALFREGLVLLLTEAGHDVVGSVADGDALLALALTTPLDVAVLDIRMPPGREGGLTAARTLRASTPGTGLLMLSQYAESHYLMRVLTVGTERVGYRLKDRVAGVGPLTDTLERIAAGEIVIESEVAGRLVGQAEASSEDLSRLSRREQAVLALMAEGRGNAAIATALHLSVKTVEKHTATIFTKLRLPDDPIAYHRRVLAVLAYLRGVTGA